MGESYIAQNAARIRTSIQAAAERGHRHPNDVRIVAVTKTAGPDVLPLLLEEGIQDAGENRWQVAREKFEHPKSTEFTWHFIGTLQTNKVKYIAPRFDWVHSVDSVELAEALAKAAVKLNRNINLLLQVNVAEEPQKHGFAAAACLDAVRRIRELPGVTLRGLMTMAPIVQRAEDTRWVFRELRLLRDRIRGDLDLVDFDQLSMGMSDDFPVAIEEGATLSLIHI